MKTRRIVLWSCVLLLLVVSTTPLFAQSGRRSDRLGLAFGIPNGVLIYRPAPFDIRLGYDFASGDEFVFLSGDWRFVDNRRLVGVLHLSLGAGIYGKFFPEGRDDSDDFEADWGARIPVGLSVLLLRDFLEFFVEVAPDIDLYPSAQFADDPVQVFAGFTIGLD